MVVVIPQEHIHSSFSFLHRNSHFHRPHLHISHKQRRFIAVPCAHRKVWVQLPIKAGAISSPHRAVLCFSLYNYDSCISYDLAMKGDNPDICSKLKS